MARSLLFSAGLAALIASNWARLEQPRPGLGVLALMAGLGIMPALLPHRRWRLVAMTAALLVAASIALDVARPYSLGRLADRAVHGFLDFYDVLVPFDATVHPLMHGVVLLAVFAFSLLGALAVAARRPLAATLVLVAGAGWPATILPGGGDLRRGAFLLAASLALIAGLEPQPRRLKAQLATGGALLVLAVAASGAPAIAKSQFTDWQNWDLYTKPANPVSVEYAWRANYDGIHFPAKRTRVFTVHAPADSAYWRATTLDAFANDVWDEDLVGTFPSGVGNHADLRADPLLPPGAHDSKRWTRADVKIDALRDSHVVGVSQPVAYDMRSIGGVQYATGGVALVPSPLSRGDEYTSWGYTPEPTPAELARSRPEYPFVIAELGQDLTVKSGFSVPPFGTPGRAEFLAEFFASSSEAHSYLPLYRVADRIAGHARNPYAATVALEAWFRSGGDFVYDETPPRARRLPPLVQFVTQTRRGYCQHFAGAMALMLRYLGIPSRVAAGFTSGRYDPERKTWNVYDRNAHTWVEVWFHGYGWLPFDPTPSRGNLSGPYSASSLSFDARGAEKVLVASAIAGRRLLRFELGSLGKPGRGDPRSGPLRGGGGAAAARSKGGGVGVGMILVLAALALALLLAAAKLVLRRSRYLTGDPRRLASACRRELVEYLLDQRIEIPRSASLGELRQLVRSSTGFDPRTFVEALGLARFGPVAEAPDAARRARRELRIVRRGLRRRLSAGSRLRGTFSLRSLLAS